ncbi:MAG TPA: hypothetical protein PKC28_09840 [Bdellovibrionales bacterium]|nr:hypothetical protein [Bdellovibrionales bacterium]
MVRSSLFLALTVWCSAAFAVEDAADPSSGFGNHYGYTFNVQEERDKRDLEMVMIDEPAPLGPPISEKIFNEKLSKDFQTQYQYRFGLTPIEQAINAGGPTEEYNYSTGDNATVIDRAKKQEQFGEYMARKLIEYHVDDWARNDPDFRPVYAVKDKISNVNMQVSKGYKFKWKYNFAGPYMDFRLENPYDVDMKLRVEMSGVVSEPNEYIFSFSYRATKKVHLTTEYRHEDGLYQFIVTRALAPNMSMSLSTLTDTRMEGPSVNQDLVMLSWAWIN